MERDPAATKVRMHDKLREYGVPAQLRNSPPVVTWRHELCKKRLLRLYATPRGWLLLSDDTRVTLPDWLERSGATHTVEQFRAGEVAAFSKRTVKGHERLLPLDISAWPSGTFELGCRKHGMGRYELSDLAGDAHEFRVTRRAIDRTKSPVVG